MRPRRKRLTKTMLEAVMGRARPYVVRRPELLDIPQPLELRATRNNLFSSIITRLRAGTKGGQHRGHAFTLRDGVASRRANQQSRIEALTVVVDGVLETPDRGRPLDLLVCPAVVELEEHPARVGSHESPWPDRAATARSVSIDGKNPFRRRRTTTSLQTDPRRSDEYHWNVIVCARNMMYIRPATHSLRSSDVHTDSRVIRRMSLTTCATLDLPQTIRAPNALHSDDATQSRIFDTGIRKSAKYASCRAESILCNSLIKVNGDMWLLAVDMFRLQFFAANHHGQYVALSHVWAKSGEQTFQERISPKIRVCCALARMFGYKFVWIDSCCIDKTSSAELSEAINSMYMWYTQAGVCFAYLEDVNDLREEASAFRQSRRLPLERLACPRLEGRARPVIEEITGIDQSILLHDAPLSSASVARRMSWASCRTTTRVEDEAYSLLGIFGLYMPTIYGEGRNAFRRLQEEIMKQIPDQTLYAWSSPTAQYRTRLSADREAHKILHDRRAEQHLPFNGSAWVPNGPYFPLLAASPFQFMFSADIHVMGSQSRWLERGSWTPVNPSATAEFTVGNYGTRTRLPIHRLNQDASYFLALLACEDSSGHAIALVLCPHPRLPDCFYITHSPQGSRYSIRTITLGMGRSLDPARNIANQSFWETRDICILKETYDLPANRGIELQQSLASSESESESGLVSSILINQEVIAPCKLIVPQWHVKRLLPLDSPPDASDHPTSEATWLYIAPDTPSQTLSLQTPGPMTRTRAGLYM
ncbi:hypothetical protein NUW54_g10076 [Trametes sanguinea]|uniref:Uncharacterized protein n=1 Tax=Trametes sanguinea TaxID=158606 RepID=A0ACC1P274_9APHY|nr:hypothetical protein NUW54_g10076 [Trametes sanguinea]